MLLRKCLMLLALFSFSVAPMMGCTPAADDAGTEAGDTDNTGDVDPGEAGDGDSGEAGDGDSGEAGDGAGTDDETENSNGTNS